MKELETVAVLARWRNPAIGKALVEWRRRAASVRRASRVGGVGTLATVGAVALFWPAGAPLIVLAVVGFIVITAGLQLRAERAFTRLEAFCEAELWEDRQAFERATAGPSARPQQHGVN